MGEKRQGESKDRACHIPTKVRVEFPVDKSHRRSVPSQEPDRANWPSEDTTTSCMRVRKQSNRIETTCTTYLNEVAVAAHEQAGATVVLALLADEIPFQEGLVSRAGHEHVHGILVGVGCEGN
jgi:hypothetical protein